MNDNLCLRGALHGGSHLKMYDNINASICNTSPVLSYMYISNVILPQCQLYIVSVAMVMLVKTIILSLIQAWCVILNPIDIRGEQSARDDKSHRRT